MTLLGYKDASHALGLPIGTLYALVSQHRIPHVRFGERLVRFDRSELMAWIDKHRVGVDAKHVLETVDGDLDGPRLGAPVVRDGEDLDGDAPHDSSGGRTEPGANDTAPGGRVDLSSDEHQAATVVQSVPANKTELPLARHSVDPARRRRTRVGKHARDPGASSPPCASRERSSSPMDRLIGETA
jgi:excisionase family DNA binding protein